MVLNAQTLQAGIMLLLPVPIAVLAGILRQDRFNPLINEIISQVIVFLVALGSFLFGVGGHLTGNPQVDFLALVAYCGWLSNTAPFKPLHGYLQTNLLSLGVSEASKLEQTGLQRIEASLGRLNAFFEGAAQNPQPTPVQQLSFPSQGTAVLPPTQAQFQASPTSSFPLAAIGRDLSGTPQPPKG